MAVRIADGCRAALIIGVLVAVLVGYRTASTHGGNVRLPFTAAEPARPWVLQSEAILWAVKPANLLSCRTAGSALRRFLRGPGSSVPLTLVAVETDSAWAASFLRTERLEGTVQVLTDRQYRAEFGTPTPTLFLVQRGRIVTTIRTARMNEDSVANSLAQALAATRDALGVTRE